MEKYNTAENIIAILGINKGSKIEEMRKELMKMSLNGLNELYYYLIYRVEKINVSRP